ncbi:DUF6159 family protein [Haloglomus halophilum]|uniref:DUF6159 family protein n=1 Tax=Haloglomus halophilum TaxID=2962672 RepID=UPI0020C9AB54|nr:DUF6159 family protein [Haloglomus halophilum]
MGLLRRLQTGFRLTGQSAGLLRRNPRFAVLPLVSGLATLVYLVAVLGSTLLVGDIGSPLVAVGVLFAVYFGTSLLAAFGNAALVYAARESFRGADPTVVESLRAAAGHAGALVVWALASAVVGLVLRAIESSSDLLGDLVAALLGLAWGALTYFVVPVVVFEDAGPVEMFRESGRTVRDIWGEAFGADFTTEAVSLLLVLPGIAVVAVALLVPDPTGAGPLLLVGVALAAVGFLFGAALQGVTKAALYRYAAEDGSVEGFDEAVLREATGDR